MSLIEAVNAGDIDQVRQLAQNRDLLDSFEWVEQPPDSGNFMRLSPLLLAVMRPNSTIVQILLEKGADPNLRDMRDISPLMIALENGNVEYVQLLLNSGATVTPNVYNYVLPNSNLRRNLNRSRNTHGGKRRRRTYRKIKRSKH